MENSRLLYSWLNTLSRNYREGLSSFILTLLESFEEDAKEPAIPDASHLLDLLPELPILPDSTALQQQVNALPRPPQHEPQPSEDN
jgi:hypothetical protein